MKTSPYERDAPAATPDQIREACESLTTAEWLKLRAFAWFRFQPLGPRRQGQDSDQLVAAALIALYEGRRTWKPGECTIFVCLSGIIRSLSNHSRNARPHDVYDVLKLVPGDPADPNDPLDKLPSTAENPQRVLEGEELERLLKDRFKEDSEALILLEALLDGKSPSEIRAELKLSQKEYETTLKRVRRAATKLINKKGNGS